MFDLSVYSFDKYRNENGLQLANNEVNTGWEPCWMENGVNSVWFSSSVFDISQSNCFTKLPKIALMWQSLSKDAAKFSCGSYNLVFLNVWHRESMDWFTLADRTNSNMQYCIYVTEENLRHDPLWNLLLANFF